MAIYITGYGDQAFMGTHVHAIMPSVFKLYKNSDLTIEVAFDDDWTRALKYNNPIDVDYIYWNQIDDLKATMVNLVYPVGSVYITTNNSISNPSSLFPGTTWQQIKDTFLWCSDTAGQSGGSKKISYEQMPRHNHYYEHVEPYDRMGHPDGSADTSNGYAVNESYWRGNKEEQYIERITSLEGKGEDYMPPYYTVKAWRRIE